MVAILCGAFPVNASSARVRAPEPTPTPATAVLQVQIIPVSRAYMILRQLFPRDHLHVDSQVNALIVVGPQSDVDAMRTVLQGIDIKNPTQASIQVVQLHLVKPTALIGRLHSLFPGASIAQASSTSVIVRAAPLDKPSRIRAQTGTLSRTPGRKRMPIRLAGSSSQV